MAITQFLWRHTLEQRAPLTVEENDTATSLWTKERASRTTTKRPERLNLKYYINRDKPVEKVYGSLWQSPARVQNDVSSSFGPSHFNTSGVVLEEKKWLWQKATAPPGLETADIVLNQPRVETTATHISESIIPSAAPRELLHSALGVQISEERWPREKPLLWKKPRIHGPLPDITPQVPLWSREKASRTTNLSPQPLSCYHVRQHDAAQAVVTGNLWTVELELAHRKVSANVSFDWLARSCRCVDARAASPPDSAGTPATPQRPYPPQPAKNFASKDYSVSESPLWKDAARGTVSLIPERIANVKAKKIIDTYAEKLEDHMWRRREDIKRVTGEKRRMDTVGTEDVKGGDLWIRGAVNKVTDIVPIKVRLNRIVVDQKARGPMWCQPVKPLNESTVSTEVEQKANPLEAASPPSLLWAKQLASRTTNAGPIKVIIVRREFTKPLAPATGNLWHKTVIKPGPVGLWKAKMKPTGLWHPDSLTPTLSVMEEARKAPLWLKTPVYRADIFSIHNFPFPANKPASCSNPPPAIGPLWEPKPVSAAVPASTTSGLWDSRQVIQRRSNSFALNGSPPSPSLSTISTLDDDLLTLSPTSEETAAVELDRILIRSDTNASFTEGLWRRREAEVQASTTGEFKSLWNASLAAPIDRELRRNKVLALEKPRVGGKKKKAPLPQLTVGNLRDLTIKEEEEASAANPALSLWRKPSPMMERMFFELSSRNAGDQGEVVQQQQQQQQQQQRQEADQSPPQGTPALCDIPSPVPLPALQPKEEPQETKVKEKGKGKKKSFAFSAFLRIPSLHKHLKPVITNVHVHATVPEPSTLSSGGRGEGSLSSSGSKRKLPWLARRKVAG